MTQSRYIYSKIFTKTPCSSYWFQRWWFCLLKLKLWHTSHVYHNRAISCYIGHCQNRTCLTRLLCHRIWTNSLYVNVSFRDCVFYLQSRRSLNGQWNGRLLILVERLANDFFLAEIFRSITVGMAASDIFHAFIRCHDIQLSTAQSLGVFHSYAIKQ